MKKIQRDILLATTMFAGLAMAAPTAAWAQGAQPAQEEEEEEAAPAGDRILVTGSRIRRSEFTSTQPIQLITAEQITLEGLVDTADILQGATTAATASQIGNFLTGFVTTGGPGVNTLSLRGLGANRSLVILNGRRAGPAGTRGQVGPFDLNVIPSSQIERVEILRDGASSIYGSDAIAGVTNIITRTSQDGGNVQLLATVPFERGGEEYRVSGSQGWMTERGYLTLGAEYYNRQPLRVGDREHLRCVRDYVFDPAGNRLDVIDPATGEFKCITTLQGIVRASASHIFPGGNVNHRRDGDFRPDPAAVYGGGFVGGDINGWQHVAGGAGAFNINNASTAIRRAARGVYPLHSDRNERRTALSPAERYTFTAFAGYDLTPTVEAYAEFMFNRRDSNQDSVRQLFPTVPRFHPDNPWGGQFNGQFYSGNAATSTVGHNTLPVALINSDSSQQVDYYRILGGLRGTFAGGWDWDLYAQFARSSGDYTTQFIYNDRVFAAEGFDAAAAGGARLANFAATGCDNQSLHSTTVCIPINWYHPNWINNGVLTPRAGSGFTDAQAAEWMFGNETGNTIYEHAYIEGVVAGELFQLPAGPLGVAAGFQLREESIDDNPGFATLDNNTWGQSGAGRTTGSDQIREVFAEFEIPLLAGMTAIESFDLNVSARFSDYDSYGSNTTYKVGVNWQIVPDFRIRASRGTGFRAPALFELFLAGQTSFAGQAAVDPCINWANSTNTLLQQNCAAAGVPNNHSGVGSSALVTTGGGLGILSAEDSEASTIGVIWTPTFADLSIGVDYFEIEVTNEVAQFGAGNIVNACYTSDTFPNSPFCTLFTRAPAGHVREFQILTIDNNYVNISSQTNRGIDVSTRYRRSFSFGDVTMDSRFTYILDWQRQIFDTFAPTQLVGLIGNPRLVGDVSLRYDRNDWTFFWGANFISSVQPTSATARTGTFLGAPAVFKRAAETTIYHNASVRYVHDQWVFQAGVQNIFDETSPSITGGGIGNSPTVSQYDLIGRRAFFRVGRSW